MFTTLLSSIFGVTIPIAFNYTIAVIILYLPDNYGLPSPARASPYIIGGSDAIPHSIPWQVISLPSSRDRLKACGGTLISNRHVLTAAHCETERLSGMVIVGAHSIEGPQVTSDGIKHRVCKIEIHPNYNEGTREYDIAILHLKEPVEFNFNVAPACLPDERFSWNETGRKMTVSGWGLLKYGRDERGNWNDNPYNMLPRKLQKLEVPGINIDKCRKMYAAHPDRKHNIADNMICAGDRKNGKISACQGDSGGL